MFTATRCSMYGVKIKQNKSRAGRKWGSGIEAEDLRIIPDHFDRALKELKVSVALNSIGYLSILAVH